MNRFAILGVVLSLTAACAHQPDYARERLSRAEASLKAKNYAAAFASIENDLGTYTKDGKTSPAKDLFAKYPEFAPALVREFYSSVDKATTPEAIITAGVQLNAIELAGIINEGRISEMRKYIEKAAENGNRSGALPFLLSDNYSIFTSLKATDAQSVIFQRSFEKLKKEPDRNLTRSLFAWVADRPESAEYKTVGASLQNLKLSRRELEGIVSRSFPEYAEKELREMTAYVVLEMDEADRLYKEDIVTALASQSNAIKVVAAPQTNALVLRVRRLQFDERQMPERLQTIMYHDYEVDTLKAALLMPRNATYAYDVATGGAELSYAFSVKVIRDGKVLSDELIRDRVSRSYSQCRNARVQNVFGGVQPANFMANNDMASRCSGSGGSTIRIEDLRNEAMRNIATRIAALQPIKDITRER